MHILTNTLDHLPEEKKQQLAIIRDIICKELDPEMIILFGSYATGKWVEDMYVEDGITYTYTSDFDILVVTPNRRSYGDWIWQKIGNMIRNNSKIGRTTLIHHPINFLNEKIRDQYYFFTDIYKEGILLYDSKRYQLDAPQKLSPEKRKKKAEDYFEYWFRKANEAYRHYNYAIKDKSYNKAAFELHQATECYYATFLLVFTDYRPKTHDIEELGVMASKIEVKLKDIFPRSTKEEQYTFDLLKKAYVDARYNKDYSITAEELSYLADRTLLLSKLVEQLCKEEIARLAKAIKPTT